MSTLNSAFSPGAAVSKTDLTEEEVDFFKSNGWVGKFSLLTKSGVEMATSIHGQALTEFTAWDKINTATNEELAVRPWFKSMHTTIPEYKALATHPFIVDKIAAILGEDIIVWGVSTTHRKPNQKHRWHVDIEHKYWKGVSVFVGLKGTSKLSSLSLITTSHKLDIMPQQLNINDDATALEFCKNINPHAELVTVDINEGDFFIFDGLTWHGSDNKGDCDRVGLIIQYSTPAYEIKIPCNYDEPIVWHSAKPQAILAKGADNYKLNTLK
jgi:ectoine hydroxylase-related dioxygenase (phytanoyl-CoA dioxygenase family)